jgi:hypothetical protein
MNRWFVNFANQVAEASGHPSVFGVAVVTVNPKHGAWAPWASRQALRPSVPSYIGLIELASKAGAPLAGIIPAFQRGTARSLLRDRRA